MDLTLIRHGQTVANNENVIQGQSNTALSALGMKQVEATARGLAGEHFDLVFSSDLDRAYITATTVAQGVDVIKEPRLREWNLGVWQGMDRDKVQRLYPAEFASFMGSNSSWDFQVPGGESRAEVYYRGKSFIEELQEKYGATDCKILAVTHGGMLGVLLPLLLGCGMQRQQRRPQTLNCGISRFNYSIKENGWRICSWNDTRYLAGLTAETGNY